MRLQCGPIPISKWGACAVQGVMAFASPLWARIETVYDNFSAAAL
ncbi:hypothetical protein Z948_3448 [Sulfitobacter donghicola DSW-25 = KCTC 12864 = JCM 14565]|nr:hypothetical protein Z948_3448 [Sulfitobacter donghicola DSW-25 = KCTC 12864 = JCM 14565]